MLRAFAFLALCSGGSAYMLAAAPHRVVARASQPAMAALPELYVYDHCPFCVRVRVALGVMGVDYKVIFMGNADVETPTAMVGKKIAPIWKDDDGCMAESLDIIAKLDPTGYYSYPNPNPNPNPHPHPHYRPNPHLDPHQEHQAGLRAQGLQGVAEERADTHAQALPYATGGSNPGLADPREACYSRVRALPWTGPRYVMSPLVPEFTQKSGRDAFVANHQMPPFEKADWKGNADMAIETKYGYYEAAYAESAANIAELNAKLLELDPLICCTECATEVRSYP